MKTLFLVSMSLAFAPATFADQSGSDAEDSSTSQISATQFPRPMDGRYFVGKFVDVGSRGGDQILSRFCAVADSGVEVDRIDSTGEVKWRSFVERLGVMHSAYEHDATVRIDSGKVVVSSIGARKIVEEFDLASGKRLSRRVFPEKAE